MRTGIGLGLTLGGLSPVISPWSNNRSILLDGVDEFVNMGNNFDKDGTAALSLAGWYKMAAAGGGAIQSIAGKTGGALEGYILRVDAADRVEFILSNDWAGGEYIQVRTNAVFADINWHFAAATYDGGGAAAGVTLYVDGSAQAVTAVTDNLLGSASNAGDFRLGRAASAVEWFDGNLDEVSVWDVELTAAQVNTELYNAGAPNNLAGHSAYANLEGWYGEQFTFPTMRDQRQPLVDGTMINMEAGDITGTVP